MKCVLPNIRVVLLKNIKTDRLTSGHLSPFLQQLFGRDRQINNKVNIRSWIEINSTNNIKFIQVWNVLWHFWGVLLRQKHVKVNDTFELKSDMMFTASGETDWIQPWASCSQTGQFFCDESGVNNRADEHFQSTSDRREEADTCSKCSYVHLRAHTDRCSVTRLLTIWTTNPTQKSSSGVSGHNGEELLLIYWKRKTSSVGE